MLKKLVLTSLLAILLLSTIFVSIAYTKTSMSSLENPTSCNNWFSIGLDDCWELGGEKAISSFSGDAAASDFIVMDEDSMQLVIRVDPLKAWSYSGLLGTVQSFEGNVIDTVSVKNQVIAVVADVPLEKVSLFMEQISQKSFVKYVEPNFKRRALLEPNDQYWRLQWGPKRIEANWAWNTTLGSSTITVAVIDTGIDYTHPDLAGNYLEGGHDWINDDDDPLDDFGHGTHCAGIIAALANNGIGIAGLAQVKILAEKVLDASGSGTDATVASGIYHAVELGAKIISMSLGGYGYSRLLHEAVKYAYENGVLLVAAAGNDGTKIKAYPAAYEEVIAVAATDENNRRASFSNWGDWIELAAPGVGIYSTMPTYHVTLNDWGYPVNYSHMDGTSMACPHVSGVAALLWSLYPSATNNWLRTQLRRTAEDLGVAGFDRYYGYGLVNARNTVERTPPDHDVLIFDWYRSEYIKLGDIVTFNVTVLNFGLNNETNIEIQLLVNGTTLASTVIASLGCFESATVTFSWVPSEAGWCTFQYYVAPVSGEVEIQNNEVLESAYVVFPPSEENWRLLATDNDEGFGCNLKAIYGQAYPDVIFFKVEYHRSWETISDVDTAIFVDADQDPSTGLPDGFYPMQNTGLGADYLIVVGWEATEMWRWNPETRRWDIANSFPLAYLEAPDDSSMFVVAVFFAQIETSGIIDCAVSDVASKWDWMPDAGHFTWMPLQYDHDLAVILKTPLFTLPGETATLNVTVCNRGIYSEADVEIQLFINGSLVTSETLTELTAGACHTLSYDWTPVQEGTYNITAYVSPKEYESFKLNNKATRIVKVHSPLINPKTGDYALYVIDSYDPNGFITSRRHLSILYDNYVAPYKIHVTIFEADPYGNVYRGYMVVDTLTRLVEEGVWQGLWYPGWIETNIDVDSEVNLLDGTGIVTGSRMFVAGPRAIECWEIAYSSFGYPYKFWYDKVSGLWIGMKTWKPSTGEYTILRLAETNVAVGVQFEHDLGVTIDAPFTINLGESAQIAVQVYNLGLWDEFGVNVQIFINDEPIFDETIESIPSGESFIIEYPWTPSKTGVYNITAYALPVEGEDVTVNNVASIQTVVVEEHFFVVEATPSIAMPGTLVKLSGYGATPYGAVAFYWDWAPLGETIADEFGAFEYEFIVPPDATPGIHEITAIDIETGMSTSVAFRVILVFLQPTSGAVGTKVTVSGYGFTPEGVVMVTFNDMLIGYAQANLEGSFVFAFNVPMASTGIQLVKAWDLGGYASANFTVIDIAQLNIQMDAGTFYFRGETAEFFFQTSIKGRPINATTITATLYGPDGKKAFYIYPANITTVATGLYKVVYNVPEDAVAGTYTLVVDAEYVSEVVQALGTSFKCFTISKTLTALNAKLEDIFIKVVAINGTVATVQTTLGYIQGVIIGIEGNLATIVVPDLGSIKVSLASLNISLQDIFLKVLAINGTVASIQTTLGTVNGTIVEIEGNIATIVVPGLGQVQADISELIRTQEAWTLPQYLVAAFSLFAAAGAISSAVLLLKHRKLKV